MKPTFISGISLFLLLISIKKAFPGMTRKDFITSEFEVRSFAVSVVPDPSD
jgi:hypothetical protein